MSIRLLDVRKSLGGQPLLVGLSLEVVDGETLVLIGPSGSGKSVLLKLIVGLLRPDAGRVFVDGEEVGSLARDRLYALRRRVGYVFQFSALFDSLTVRENVAMGLRRVPGLGEAEIQARVEEALGLVGLAGYGDRLPAQLSGGQRKRAGLARAIVTRPTYLLYDEPTTGLDPVATAVIDRLVLRLRDELGVTSVVVTHDLLSARRIADRVAMLYAGRIRRVVPTAELDAVDDPVVRAFVEGRPELLQEVA